MTPDIADASGVRIVLEGRARLRWARAEASRWRLVEIWPSERERRSLQRSLARGQKVLAVQGAAAVDVDLLDEEIADEHAVAPYLTQRDRGVATVRLTALDWAPESISREAQQFIEQQRRLHQAATGGRAAVLTPALGRRRNLRLVHIDSLDVDRLSSACVQQLAELAFPHPFHHRRRRYEHVPRREGHPGGSCDGRIDHREHR
ncbi:hypothetical protein [Microbacterium oleivorans]|uniref:Uncharacterized protein n=1 Tax=Microbacterium oleivorans TaxID=273677 RepID=A0A7D5EUB8_9MICO|nr:hypothetical protein [Microbacterium oleivorans]QLD10972.1 hypothetical protein HW566_03715 [Microbacterium oleivorans]